ncbi:MAG: site-specific DNA-methyltransferase [Anaerolineaceae bacterium]|nr:site-specific DNA-methyltransferase [Anaerolineaceae bacterium]
MNDPLPLDTLLVGNCIEIMEQLPAESVDLIFADPPYNLQLRQDLWRPNQTLVNAVNDSWDQFSSFQEYDAFTHAWLAGCKRVLKPRGTLWVIGTYHNIHRVGTALQDLGFWILNSIIWIKANPMPNFRGVRFTNAHETLIWAQKEAGAQYTFNHHAMKALNEDLQMRSDWYMPICNGRERLRINGTKVHATQKPEALLFRVLLASTNPGDVILDPFFGTGTTGVVARKLQRHWIGIEKDQTYVGPARERIKMTPKGEEGREVYASENPRRAPRIPFGALLEHGLLQPGQLLYFGQKSEISARILADGSLEYEHQKGSIHKIARLIETAPGNGWTQWFYVDKNKQQRVSIDELRKELRNRFDQETHEDTAE